MRRKIESLRRPCRGCREARHRCGGRCCCRCRCPCRSCDRCRPQSPRFAVSRPPDRPYPRPRSASPHDAICLAGDICFSENAPGFVARAQVAQGGPVAAGWSRTGTIAQEQGSGIKRAGDGP
jgi:hypothetical protein